MKTRLTVLFLILLCTLALYAVPRDMVVVEIGTGTWCQYCPGAAMGADDLVINKKRAAIVENHNGDPYANDASNARNTYYALTGYPTATFDGGNAYVGGNHTTSLYPQYQSRVTSRLNVPSHYTITATGTHTGLVYNATVTVTRLDADTNTNLKLHGVLTESGMQVAWQGQTHLEFVQRLMAPNQNGTAIDFTSGETQTVNLTFTALPAWNAEEFEFVFFLQNNTTKEVLQGCKYSPEALENVYPVTVQAIDLGTVNNNDIATQLFTINNWWSQDMTGEMSIDNDNFFVMPETRDAFAIPFMESADYTLFFTPTQPGTYNANLTITTDIPAFPTITIPVTATVPVVANDDNATPEMSNALLSAYPNPFHSDAALRYIVKTASQVEISIYNLKGEKVNTLIQTISAKGMHTVIWNGLDSKGNSAPAGMYFARMSVNDRVVNTTKLAKIK